MVESSITTGAVGRTRAPPDEISLQVRARSVEEDVNDARRGVAEQAARLRSVLEDEGVPGEEVRTIRFDVSQRKPRYDRDADDPDWNPYEARETVGVTLRDVDALGDVLSAAVEVAEYEIESVTFGFRTETERELHRDAFADAVTTARKKAEAAADAEGLAVGDVESMTTDDRSHPRRTGTGLQGLSDTSSTGSPESGPIAATANVEVAYELVEKSN
jgi:uncharacterized protein YggE